MAISLSDEIRQLLDHPNFAHLATLMPDGSPQSVDFDNPYVEAQIRGRVVERRPDPDLKVIDPISRKYVRKPFPFRNPEGRVALIIEVEKARCTKLPFEHTPAA
jgi:hypothetical protein